MLPRVAPQTALALLANNVSEETAQENWKLPYPSETGEAIKEEQMQIENQKSKEVGAERCNFVITNDPVSTIELVNGVSYITFSYLIENHLGIFLKRLLKKYEFFVHAEVFQKR